MHQYIPTLASAKSFLIQICARLQVRGENSNDPERSVGALLD